MSKSSKVSVVMVVHEAYLPYLNTAINHLKSQSPHELILVANGCSLDIPCISIRNSRLSHACNVGIEAATGEYIVRLDADDWIDSNLIQTEESFLDAHPEVDCVWCDYINAHEHKKTDDFEVFMLEFNPQFELEHACGAMFRKSVWRDLGGYDEELEYQEAFDFWARFSRAGYRAERIEVPMYLYRRGHESMSTNPERDAVRKQLEDKYK